MRWVGGAVNDCSTASAWPSATTPCCARSNGRAAPVTSDDVLRVVGIDDWAWRKGQHHFGTILVDLERRRVVDLLPTRAADVGGDVARGTPEHPTPSAAIATARMPRAFAVARHRPARSRIAFIWSATCATRCSRSWDNGVDVWSCRTARPHA